MTLDGSTSSGTLGTKDWIESVQGRMRWRKEAEREYGQLFSRNLIVKRTKINGTVAKRDGRSKGIGMASKDGSKSNKLFANGKDSH